LEGVEEGLPKTSRALRLFPEGESEQNDPGRDRHVGQVEDSSSASVRSENDLERKETLAPLLGRSIRLPARRAF